MQKLSGLPQFQERQNIILQGFDPVSAGGFTQVPNFILKKQTISATAKVVYSMLLSYAWNNNRVFPGQDRMAEDIGAGKRTVVRVIAELEKARYLEVQRRGQGLTNIYILHHTVKRGKKRG